MTTKKYIFLDLNHWIRLSRVHVKGEGSKKEKQLYQLLLNSALSEEVIFPLSLVHLQEIGGSRYDRNQRLNLAKTVIAFTKENCMHPFFITSSFEASYATIKLLEEKISGSMKSFAKELLDEVIDAKKAYPYFPIGKGISVLLGATPQLVDRRTGREITEGIFYEKAHQFLKNPEKLIELASSELMRKEYNKTIVDYEKLIRRERTLSDIRKNLAKDRREDAKFTQFIYWSGISKIVLEETIKWSKLLSLDIKKAITMVLGTESEVPTRDSIYSFHKLMPSIWCYFKLERFRDRHYTRKLTPNDIFDIDSISTAIPYCDIVVCDKFYANAAREGTLDTFCGTTITHKLDDLKDLI